MGAGFELPDPVDEQNVDYVCFTDRSELEPNGWSVRVVHPTFLDDLNRSSREQKIRPHRWLSEYTRSIYIDSSVQLKASPISLWEYMMPSKGIEFSAFHHSFRDTVREEFNAVLEARFEDDLLLADQLESYINHFPDVVSGKPVWGGLLARRHNEKRCISAMEMWLSHVLRYSRRDQLSLPIALMEFTYDRVNIIERDIYDTEFHIWPRPGYERPKWYATGITSLAEKQEKFNTLFSENRAEISNGSPKLATPEVEGVTFHLDDAKDLFFVRDAQSQGVVFVSDPKRLELYTKGVEHRKSWLLRDYRIPIDLVRPQDIVVDVGANNGELGIWAQSKGARYLGFEPDPKAFRALKENVGGASAFPIALSFSNGTTNFYLSTEHADSSLFKPETVDDVIAVEKRTLDSALLSFDNSSPIRLLKIEAEGMEPEVLAGAAEALSRAEYVAVDAGPERGGENTVPAVVNTLCGCGFVVDSCFLLRGTFFMRNGRLSKQKRKFSARIAGNGPGTIPSILYFLARRKGMFSEKRRQKFLASAAKRDARYRDLKTMLV
ncbi:FkbM family methyltransferase [Ruegeria sp. AU67]|uniref:FkbM family methyltransferase n=1 Tax=Ruegeria sp. AU67 TaxID=2108530 RepID=UPI001F02E72F|nr:FkbM family methyltransferase [Ruegeria sp. AU67]